jgi:undecaprenyl-diphosphatase
MKKEGKIIIIILIVLSLLLSFYLDNFLIKQVSSLRSNFMNIFFLVVTFLSSKVVLFLSLTSLFLWQEKKRRWIFPLWLSLFCSSIVALIIKIIIQRPRPFQVGIVSLLPRLQEASYSIWNFSFPSSHSLLAFCVLPILIDQFPKLKHIWFILAGIIAFSRVYFGLHFFSDIIAGALIGYLIGALIVRKEKENSFGKKIYNKIMRR